MAYQAGEVPLWMQHLADNQEMYLDFAEWAAAQKLYYAQEAATRTTSFDQVLGFRFMIGEMERFISTINQIQIEELEARRQHNG